MDTILEEPPRTVNDLCPSLHSDFFPGLWTLVGCNANIDRSLPCEFPSHFHPFLQWRTLSWRTPLTLALYDLAASVCRMTCLPSKCFLVMGSHSILRIAPGPGARFAEVLGVRRESTRDEGLPRCTSPHHCSHSIGLAGSEAAALLVLGRLLGKLFLGILEFIILIRGR